MKNVIIVILLFIFVPQVHGATNFGFGKSYLYYPNGIDSIIGTVQEQRLNTIVVRDELEKVSRRFIYLSDRGEYKAGDRVRLYYYPATGVVKNIRREPLQEYQKNGRNLGYMFNK
jgi:hypothetical protein